eukprot:2894623-Pleurochrysis_carterae.AAC.1
MSAEKAVGNVCTAEGRASERDRVRCCRRVRHCSASARKRPSGEASHCCGCVRTACGSSGRETHEAGRGKAPDRLAIRPYASSHPKNALS